MAKKTTKSTDKINKSQAIRDALKNSPNASPKELSAELTAKGIDASPTYVSMIKFNMKAKRKGPKKVRSANQTGDTLSASELLEAKKLVDRVGSIEKAQSLLGTLKRLL